MGTLFRRSFLSAKANSMDKPDLTLYLGGTRSGKSARAEARVFERADGPVLYVATAETRSDDPSMTERIRRHRARRPENWRTLECPLHLGERIAAALMEYGMAGNVSGWGTGENARTASMPPRQSNGGNPTPRGGHSDGAPRSWEAEEQDTAPKTDRDFKKATYEVQGEAKGVPTILLDCVTLWVSNILFSLPDPEDLLALEEAVRHETEELLAVIRSSGCRWVVVSGETGLGGIEPTRLGRNYHDGLGLANQLIAAQAREAFLVIAGRLLRLEE